MDRALPISIHIHDLVVIVRVLASSSRTLGSEGMREDTSRAIKLHWHTSSIHIAA
jgi:hypothetical protein